MYIHNLPDYPAFEKKFNDAGYKLDVDLSNSLIITDKNDDWVEYDDLSTDLQLAMDEFAENNNLN